MRALQAFLLLNQRVQVLEVQIWHFLYPAGSRGISFCTWDQHLDNKTKQTYHPHEHPSFLVHFILFLVSGKYTKS